MNPFRLLFAHRHILYATTLTEVRGRYTGTLFGLLWAAMYPFLFLGLYAVVYTLILRVRLEQYSSFEYVLLIFAGLIPFIGFAEALGSTVSSVVSNKNLLKNTLFPIELLPVKAVLGSSISMTVGLVGLLLILWGKGEFSIVQVTVLAVFALQIVFTTGVAWLLSALNVFFRDIGQVIGILTLFLMMVSPIAYTQDMVPDALRVFMYPNPLFYIMECYRQILIFHNFPTFLFLILTIMSFGMFYLGYMLFTKLKSVFGEYV